MNKKEFIIMLITMFFCGVLTMNLIERNKPEIIKGELLCKQVYEIKSKFNIVLECVKVAK